MVAPVQCKGRHESLNREVAACPGKAAGATASVSPGLWLNPRMLEPPSSNAFRLIAREIKKY